MADLHGNIIEFGAFRLDTAAKILRHNGEVASLPLKAVELLSLLAENRNKVVTKAAILDEVWGDSFVEESVLTQNIYTLRRFFAEYGETSLIKTVPRRGYIFNFESPLETSMTIERDVYEEIEIIETGPEPDLSALTGERSARSRNLAIGLGTLVLLFIASSVLGFRYFRIGQEQASVSSITSIAVLPFRSFDKEAVDEGLRLRLMDSIITKLGSIRSISVRPTSSTMRFIERNEDSVEIGKRLLVDAILEGSVQQEANNIRLTLQLVSVKTGKQIWAGKFDGNADALLNLQDLIAAELIEKVVSPESAARSADLVKRLTSNPEAYERYLRGRYHWNTRTEEGFNRAIDYFEQAVSLDPSFAEAFSGLGDTHIGLYDYGIKPASETIPKAKTAISRALQLNPNSAETFSSLSAIQFLYDRDPKEAELSIKHAIELNPQYGTAHLRYGWYLTVMGRFDEAARELETARQMDPTSAIIQTNIGYLYASSGQIKPAEEQFYKVIETNPQFSLPYWYLGGIYFHQNRKREMFEKYLTAFGLDSGNDASEDIKRTLNTTNEATALSKWRDKLEKDYAASYFPPTNIALIAALQQDRERTLKWLAEAESKNDPWLIQVKYDHEYDFVRDDPRFLSILKKLDLGR